MKFDLEGKRALVTGGSKGIGRKICETFLAEGATVEFCARNPEQIAISAEEMSKLGVVRGTSVDVSDGAALTAWVNAAADRMGGLDCVVSNASALAIGSSDESWQNGFNVDVLGAQHLVDAAAPHLEKSAADNGDGSFVIISSTAAAETQFANAYGAVKAAINHLCKGLAKQNAGKGVRFNSVSPGTIYFEGGSWHDIEKGMPDLYKQTLARNPMGRMGAPEEIANAVVFLSSPRSTFTTGANLVIDGALTSRVNF
jgi:3-oxoacyl-[acyl-carrier protein] reductase